MTVGVFDSGAGGLLSLSHLRALMPRLDLVFFADRKNAPYGKKDEKTLVFLVKQNIDTLRMCGAKKILIACCTAGTVYDMLPEEYKTVALPIILPTARAAVKATKTKKIGVLATEATIHSRAFSKAIKALDCELSVKEVAAQELVFLAENNLHDKEKIKKFLTPFKNTDIDTLVLGCTHFPLLSKEINEILPSVKLISSAYEGALAMSESVEDEGWGRVTEIFTRHTQSLLG